MSLAILCPTRGRPEQCANMVVSALATSAADIFLYVDDDDPHRANVSRLAGSRVHVYIGPRVGRGQAINDLCEMNRNHWLYMVVSDDIAFTRTHWDTDVERAATGFEDDIGLVHVSAMSREPYVNWAVIPRRVIDVLGWWNAPGMRSFCQDTVLQLLFTAVGRMAHVEEPCLRHDCLVSEDGPQRLAEDEHAFLWYCAREFGRDLEKLKSAMEVPHAVEAR